MHLTNNKSTPAVQFLEGVYGNSVRIYLQESSNSCRKFHEMRSIKTQFSRRRSKCTLRIRNWSRPVANKKTIFFELPSRHLLRLNDSRKNLCTEAHVPTPQYGQCLSYAHNHISQFPTNSNHLFTVELVLKGVFRTCLGSKGSVIRGRCLWVCLCWMPFLDSWIWRVLLSFLYFFKKLISYK